MMSTPLFLKFKRAFNYKVALVWQRIYFVENFLKQPLVRIICFVLMALALAIFVGSLCFSPNVQNLVDIYHATGKVAEGLQNLALSVGSALIGATAIVASLVLFAMQINVERMPYGLFQRLSSDFKLLSMFAIAFMVAVAIAVLSLFVSTVRPLYVLCFVLFSTVVVLLLFVGAYRRALFLINPLNQLMVLLDDTKRELRAWGVRAQRAIPLIEANGGDKSASEVEESAHDLARTIYFHRNSRWVEGTKRSVRHAMSFARRYSEAGDHDVSNVALITVVNINAVYIAVKGKTFYADSSLVENPLATDDLINDILESIRQHVQDGILRRDERQIEQTLKALAHLVRLYLSIDYSNPRASKTHALLAAGYLSSAVQAVVPHDMADVLMEGLRLMGQSAQCVLSVGSPNDIVLLSQKIAIIACAGFSKEDYHPVTLEGVAQLADITFQLLHSKNGDIHFAAESVRKNIVYFVKLFLKVPRTPLLNSLSEAFGPYYSSTSLQSFRAKLTTLANNLAKAQADNVDAQQIIRNIENWADGLYRIEKELLIASIKEKSFFVFDVIYWITGITDVLLAVSNAPACHEHSKDKLQKHALLLISTFTSVPDDEESLVFVENYKFSEILFESANSALSRGCGDVAETLGRILLSWSFKVGVKGKDWLAMAHGLCGFAAFSLMIGHDQGLCWLKELISKQFSSKSTSTQEIFDNAAKEILIKSSDIYDNMYSHSGIDRAVAAAEHDSIVHILVVIAASLSTETT
ncbi:hypothetical protein [Solidesulfovibrio carbinolicus]|uniref:hypothetical protein n=1 Tax=Solidesulfovibrio carbinolicus TaxID=296842 RepID=UPI001010794A|nr:hypothetical protein [Solidesulfovibrio carbinolicus]